MNIKKLDTGILKKDCIQKAIIYLNDINQSLSSLNIIREYPFINAVGVMLSTEQLTKLSHFSSVKYICSVNKIYSLDLNNHRYNNIDNNVNNHFDILKHNIFSKINNYTNNLYELFGYNYPNASNISVAVLDTGVSRHLDLCGIKNRLIIQKDLCNSDDNFYDDNGHGTFVAGVISSSGICSGKLIKGVSPNANIISVKIMNSNGESDVFSALDGMQWVADNYIKYNIKVVCMSFGASPLDKNDPLVSGVDELAKLGISVVCASGNSGEGTFMSPAISDNVFSVGSTDNQHNISSFTSRGTINNTKYPTFYALGENVVSLSNKATYVTMSGTSVACPMVCGMICNLIAKYPYLSNKDIKHKLKELSIKIDDNYVLDLSNVMQNM